MATTFSNLSATRRVVVGTSSTGQGLDGVSELTRTAYESMLAQSWTVSTDAPAIPVHDYDRALPSGDAWKACYGYDASARTERGACGAVVYSFAIPADALTGEPCNITALSLRVIGDRYLDAGVDVHAVLSASAEPPAVAALVARTPDATVCATGDQEEAPNQRHGVTATVELAPAAAATAYIHIALLLHDYLTTRGAWIEGGAMLADGSVAVTFSRDVAADSISAVLDAGKKGTGTGTIADNRSGVSPAVRAEYCIECEYVDNGSSVAASDLTNPSTEAMSLLNYMDVNVATGGAASRALWNIYRKGAQSSLYSEGVGLFTVLSSVECVNMRARYVVRSGIAPGAWRSASVSDATAAGPIDIALYAVLEPPPVCLVPATTILRRAFWTGGISEMLVRTDTTGIFSSKALYYREDEAFPDIPTTSIPVQCLATLHLGRDESFPSRITFREPLRVDWIANLILAVRPSDTIEPADMNDVATVLDSTEITLNSTP
ncbi:MAG: hypothetical protein IJV65_09020 [Kiritimatiellae bacterium]|nr:hypothetical protein [Kiritimatiellia bacterium]